MSGPCLNVCAAGDGDAETTEVGWCNGLAAPLAVLLHIKPTPLANFRPIPIGALLLANLGSLVMFALLLSPSVLGLGIAPIFLHVEPPPLANVRALLVLASVSSKALANPRTQPVFVLISAAARISVSVVF